MSNLKKVVLATALLGLVGMALFAYFVYTTIFVPNTAFENDEAHIFIRTAANFQEVLQEVEPLLKNPTSFKALAHRKGYSDHVKPGHYVLKKGMNNNAIINTLRSQNIPIKVKFNNQERLENLAGTVASQIEADSLQLLEAFRDSTFLASHGFSEDAALGMYIPNTYELYWNTNADEFRDRMAQEYGRFWNSSRMERSKEIGLSPEEVISLAAIVQKETAKVEERSRVAGVYLNRLKKGMLLQADPTVIYAKKQKDQDFDQVIKRVLFKDLEIDSPYNTYKYQGLPPGPISMPDISSIEAVLNAENHNYYFFVADVQNPGYHKFARNLSEHNKNRAAYVRWISSQGINR